MSLSVKSNSKKISVLTTSDVGSSSGSVPSSTEFNSLKNTVNDNVKADLIWSGTAVEYDTITLSKDVSNYKFLVVHFGGSPVVRIIIPILNPSSNNTFEGSTTFYNSSNIATTHFIHLTVNGKSAQIARLRMISHNASGNHSAVGTGLSIYQIYGIK